jgi:hypothetical protein
MARHAKCTPMPSLHFKKPLVVPRSGSWWLDVPVGSMTAAAKLEQPRMSQSREAQGISASNYVGFGNGNE